MNKVGVALVGSRFISSLHHEAFSRIPQAEVLAVASPTIEHVRPFAV